MTCDEVLQAVIKQWTTGNSTILDASSCVSFFNFHLHSNNDFCEVFFFDTMISTSLLITLVLAVTEALAVSCDLSNVSLSPQDNRTLSSIVLGVGFQYYNCSTTGKYT